MLLDFDEDAHAFLPRSMHSSAQLALHAKERAIEEWEASLKKEWEAASKSVLFMRWCKPKYSIECWTVDAATAEDRVGREWPPAKSGEENS